MYVILLLIIFISFMNDNNELIPIIIDINLDIETIDPDSFNITVFYDFDNIDIPLNDITNDIVISIEHNTFPIHITILNDNYQFDPFQFSIPDDLTITDLIYDLELYHIGIPQSIISIEHHHITLDNNFILYNNCSLFVFIDNNIAVDTSIYTNHFSIDPHNSSILQLVSSNNEDDDTIVSPKTLTTEHVNHMETISYCQINYNTTHIIGGDICVICSTEYLNNSILRVLPCKHAFHVDCIDKWLLHYSKKCPICKQ